MEKKWFSDALIVNRDPDWIFPALTGETKEEMQASIERYFSMFGGHRITDVALCVYAQSAVIPSKCVSFMGDRLSVLDRYLPEDPYRPAVAKTHRCWYEFGLDPVQTFVDKMGEFGIRPWITLRMNDAHYLMAESSLMRDDIHEGERAAGHVLGEKYGYFGGCYDYTYPKIREIQLGFIGEILERYDLFGLELDFQRELFCFDYLENPDCHKIMTEFIREVRKLTDGAQARRGHPVRLMIRTHQSPERAKEMGFDIVTMCREGLLDAVVPTPRWECVDSGIPVKKWRALLGEDIAVFPGIEMLSLQSTFAFPDQLRAYAAAFFAQGADGFYLNNFQSGSPADRILWQVHRDNCTDGHRAFVVTYQDLPSPTLPGYRPLPMPADGEISLEIGEIRAADRVQVLIDFEGEGIPALTVGGKTVTEAAQTTPVIRRKIDNKTEANLTPHRPLLYDISGAATDCTLVLSFRGQGTVHYLNVMIDAAE